MTKNREGSTFQHRLIHELHEYHESIEVEEPEFDHLLHLVQTEQEKWQERIWIELMLLWGISAFILTLLALTYVYTPLIFGLFQVAAITGLAIYFYKEKVKEMRYDPS
ncbi:MULTISPECIES: DUF5345 family protein [Pontibacillus]|uniref:DUF5345 family protein n=1 Tax=Pontibacillus chungwhensis TaxID=265426 RepID=A0ABY8UV26_9BACI|nr:MULTISPECIES: DUF5345 family protein [Pontibacillus]MCD5322949.1 DUF5345 family protein [Pontibacillus sp. HN14]WIF96344.1 DUF5345 family protein [Pontibacillus chungwhensis]